MSTILIEALYSIAMSAALIVEGIAMFRYCLKRGQEGRELASGYFDMLVVVQIGSLAMTVPTLWWFEQWVISLIGLWLWAGFIAASAIAYIIFHSYSGEGTERLRDLQQELRDEIRGACNAQEDAETRVLNMKRMQGFANGQAKPVCVRFSSTSQHHAVRVDHWGFSAMNMYFCVTTEGMEAIWKYYDDIHAGNKKAVTSQAITAFLKAIKNACFIEICEVHGEQQVKHIYQLEGDDPGYSSYVVGYHYFSSAERTWNQAFLGLSIHNACGETIEKDLWSLPFVTNVTEFLESVRQKTGGYIDGRHL